LQVRENRNGAAGSTLDLAHDIATRLMILVRAMAEVKTEHIRTRFKQGLDGFLAAAGRTQRGHDLGLTLTSHVFYFLQD
jgi:hypothetical protein